jgi:Zn-dependent metalloprotease
MVGDMRQGIVPPYLLSRIAELGAPSYSVAAEAARRALSLDAPLRTRARLSLSVDATDTLVAEMLDAPDRLIHDAENREQLPGVVVRREGDQPTGDVAVDEAYDGLGATFALFSEVYGRNSIDDAGLRLDGTVHYGLRYDNAFWDGSRMVFGDGDGEIFDRFTRSVSVIGHELAHGVTQYTANLVYQGQPGALNESISDVFGALVEQYLFGQSATDATWLIGEGLFTPAVEGRALRSMSAPGTAYDDDVLGRDPQPGHMDDYLDTTDDNGGVHLNSGIPNRAFHLAAVALGGNAWERAGQVWYDTITADLSPMADFVTFATATLHAAAARYGEDSEEVAAVRGGWNGVGIGVDRQ